MNDRLGAIALPLLLAVLAAFVWFTSAALPEVVASHFGSSGAADGFMPRGVYIAVFLALIVGVPLLLAFLPGAVAGQGGRNLDIPDRDAAPRSRAFRLVPLAMAHALMDGASVLIGVLLPAARA